MAEPAILRQLFVRIGLTQAVADTIVDDHNINSTATLTKIKPDTVSKLVKTLRHPGGGGNGHAIPFQVQQDITDVAWLLKHRVRTSCDPAIPTIGLPVLTDKLEIYRDHEEQWTEPSFLDIEITRNDWNKTFRTIEESLTNFKGVHGCPLSYTICVATAIPADPDPSTDYASIEDKIIARAPIVNAQGGFVATFCTDNTTLWKLLSVLFKDTVDWTDIKHCARTKDGRTAFLDLKSARLVAQYTNNVSAEIERRWLALSYAGPKRNWKFDDYARNHKECFLLLAELDDYQEPDEQTRVRKLIDQIVTRELDTAINMIIASPTMGTSFDESVAHIKGFIDNREDTLVLGKRSRDGRHIASVNTRHRPPNEWHAMPKDERNAIMEERKQKKRKLENGNKKDKTTPKDSGAGKKTDKKNGRTTFKELKRRIAELESKESAQTQDGNDNDDRTGGNASGNAANGNRTNPALNRGQPGDNN
ncbi:unnamed protein product [Cylindrotheca closterium]|uniref:Uncharacterized protein n=1 Tax=Cylindrotheca closterium TaxID=2856 RepID=A0AAD2FEW1_9STRA|nr:unnamed protein product [Cylindrotheca closterium]